MQLAVICWRLLLAGCLLPGVLFFSCGKKEEQPTLPDEKISRIMADLFIADAATSGLSGFQRDSLGQVYFRQVLQMHRTTKEEYEKNLRLIAKDLPRMKAVVKKAEAMLGTEKKGEKE